MIHQRCINKL